MSTTLTGPPPEALAVTVDVSRPILVCGVGRSGTSLLQSMLNAHPEIAVPPETHFFRRYVAPRRTRRHIEAESVDALVRRLRDDAEFARCGMPVEEVVAGERDGALDLVRVYRRILEHWAQREAKPRVGDKDPRNLDFLPELAAAFPDAFVVHIVRDPRAVVHSRTKAAWSASRPWWSHAIIAQEQLRRGRRNGSELFGDRYLEVRYERLLADPKGELERVCEHVGVAFDAAMLEFGDSARRLVADDEMSWKKETLGPLLTENDAKWREGLEASQVAFVEAVCVEAFGSLEYERTAPPRGIARIGGHGPVRALARAAYTLRRWKETLR